jgi:death-on-curing protein
VKAAALLHSLARNHAMVDGNKRLAWTACRTFLAINGQWISAPEDERFDFVIRVATGVVPDLDKIAEQLRTWSYQEG